MADPKPPTTLSGTHGADLSDKRTQAELRHEIPSQPAPPADPDLLDDLELPAAAEQPSAETPPADAADDPSQDTGV